MANNPYVNKVVFGSATLVDLTGTTATADKILSGYGAFGADGAWMDGTASSGGRIWQDTNGYVHLSDDGTLVGVEPLTVTENGTYTAPTGKAYSPVTVNVSGGSSDFSTAQVTFVNNTADKVLMCAVAAIIDGDFSCAIGLDGLPESMSFAVVLYKGLNVIACSNGDEFTVTTSGNVNYDSEEWVFHITGDCTITIS